MNQIFTSSLSSLPTPAYVVDEARLKANMQTAARIRAQAGCRVLLATKAFALPAVFPLMREYLDGTTASGLFEARLGKETFGKEVHVFAPAYTDEALQEILPFADHIYFNSVAQVRHHLKVVRGAGKKIGIRINPNYSKVTLGGELYDPCAPTSRFGVSQNELDQLPWDEIDILHAHSLCESMHDGSVGLIEHMGKTFGPYIKRVSAVNFGGGHFINKKGYDVDALIAAIRAFRAAFNVDVILEPGSGHVVDAGYLVTAVLDILPEKKIAILDASACCHMPDVLEVPYTPPLLGAEEGGVLPHTYTLGGNTCMTGDVIGTYSFAQPLKIGDRLVFGDMLQYSFVKNNTFNGQPLPEIGILREDGSYETLRRFGYEDFVGRLMEKD
ncbi:MAG: carboxynorspermidine decarboxylase [Patescibacteria group bacterium]